MTLPATLQVIERGWLSSNSVLGLEGDEAALIDSGYVTHAAQTVALVRAVLAGRRLTRIINTHSHSDHIGGNAALQAAFGCTISVPAGLHATIAEWDENALLLSPLGQQSARFGHDELLAAHSEFSFGGLNWQCLPVPGHDMEALAYYNPEKRLLISGDALWENGFGVIFPELLGEAEGIRHTRETLEKLARLPIDCVIPGHGSPFVTVDVAFERAFRRLEQFAQHLDRLAWHALKVIIAFALMERQSLPTGQFPAFILSLPFAVDINRRYLGLDDDTLCARLQQELAKAGALHAKDGRILAGASPSSS